MIVKPIKTTLFREGEDLVAFLLSFIRKPREKSIIVITSKIVALSERRTVAIGNTKEKEKLIKKESNFYINTKYVPMTLVDGMAMPSAGIDESNACGKYVLLPEDSFKTAKLLRKKLQQKYHLKNLGVLITDSRTLPLRSGVVGVALGYAGFKGVRDYKGKKDLFGRKFKFSSVNVADSLATAAILVMGEGAEQQPLALVKDAPVEFRNNINQKELKIAVHNDIYVHFFSKLSKRKK
ncbi:MAG: hypothetical protein A2832_01080 [Candidatus Zambryskibacteria bacterium RIFCSPHIGHO2_01_FULL_44_22b]|uniref:Coenzyme F420:L-glutamate ligase-like domain-containing protein n=2 Tax=Candidatus Zambryskiibacteriota TaxID=1817925 RepID=A0A1G2T1R3_9BACT|nr:MAG: hypothetical protein A2832_01080 [Candidatus Zambryskibacteria bacterium RIFCSPHIGHO2_01_FULL_44_22b]OHB05071.1 MAG: hypothetical protein A3B16_00555 [Candidatus Zambryskibacteria bacterium RIFCSPLOWO2_01_FULL_45_43]